MLPFPRLIALLLIAYCLSPIANLDLSISRITFDPKPASN